MDFVDMHTHSNYSDGTLSPSELIKQAHDIGLKGIALTDHDTVEGIPEALEISEKIGIELMPGVEISTDSVPEMHILGYFRPDNYSDIEPALSIPRSSRTRRNEMIIDKLNELGYKISVEDVKRQTGGNIIGRVHIASSLVEKGYLKSVAEAFSKLLADGKPAFIKREKLSPETAVRMITEAGGAAVLAHPKYLRRTGKSMEDLILELKSYGLKGIETFYADNTLQETYTFEELSRRHGLIATGGSDFHGDVREGVSVGVGRGNLKVSYKSFEKIKQTLKKE